MHPGPTRRQPALSVIVYGGNPQGHLGELLASLAPAETATAAHATVEIVVAAVGDWARQEAERHAAHDPRTIPLPLPDGTGDTAARTAGAARATGRWLHFVHAGDGLPPGALRTITDRLAELEGPEGREVTEGRAPADILVLDHIRSTWNATGARSDDGWVLARAGRRTLTLTAFPNLLWLTPILGNRVIRTEYWRGSNLTAVAPTVASLAAAEEEPAAEAAAELAAEVTTDLAAKAPPTEDEAHTAYATLLHANRIACLHQVAYEVRESRPESRPPVTAREWFATIDRYDGLLRLLHRLLAEQESPPAPYTAHPGAVLYEVMIRDLLRTFARSRMPDPVAREFFRRASEVAVRWKPAGHRARGGFEGIRRSLLEENAYAKYRAFQAANHARRDLRSAVTARRRQVGAKLADHRYRKALSAPVDPNLAVFSAYWDRGVACNPAAIAAKLTELAPHVRPVWVVARDRAALLPPGTDHVVPGTPRYWEVLARAKYLVNNVNYPNAVIKRPDAVHLQTHHGTPLKRMGLDQLEYPAAAKGLDFDALLARVDKWDYSLSANSHSTRMWERAYPSRYTPLDYGYPRNDVYYSASSADIRAIRDRLGIAPGRRALLYAPTHRDYEAGWTPRLDLASLADALGEDTVVLVRGHYFYGATASPLAELRRAGRVLDVSSYDPVEELALAADALITDYSSIMFDYANLGRPIVIYADDWETYAKTRGVYFDLPAEAPGHVASTQAELTEILTTDAWRDESARKSLDVFRSRFCEFDDGRAAERVVRRVFLGESEESLPPTTPVADRTPAPTPQEANPR